MFAVIKTGGKQYKLSVNDVVRVEKLAGNAGDSIEINDVVMFSDGSNMHVGSPLVAGASVSATVLEQAKNDKVIIFKKRRRHNYRRKTGHRQQVTVLRVTDLSLNGEKKASASTEPKKTNKTVEAKAKNSESAETKEAAPKKVTKKAAASKSQTSSEK